MLNPVTYVLINIATVILIQKAGVEVNLGGMQQGQVVALYNYMAQMIVELIKLASLIITLNKSAACAGRVADILKVKSTMVTPLPPHILLRYRRTLQQQLLMHHFLKMPSYSMT